ncbi:MAG TPA: peptidoglycan-associated lipoprotein Pal [Thiotrichaceae bacterium]|nr:peptidoglycan-associated lipoprotein Pal [Thiotrichaceae bacterium]HIM07576.1 peptidoglycan-associated lipoprotein Pal [Gammaproteobacteria bacterium]
MSIRLLLILSLSSLLFGCGMNPFAKDEPVAVEEQSQQTTSTPVEMNNDNSNAQAYGTDDSSTSAFSPLDDPQSALSIRVIYFEYNSNEISSEYRSAIEAHSAYLSQNITTSITLEGHADERGSREYNLALGESRAKAVKKQMLLLGASSSQIRLVSYGEERPSDDGHDESSWQQNRRVEILY